MLPLLLELLPLGVTIADHLTLCLASTSVTPTLCMSPFTTSIKHMGQTQITADGNKHLLTSVVLPEVIYFTFLQVRISAVQNC